MRISLQQALLSLKAAIPSNINTQQFADPRSRFEAVKMPETISETRLNKFWQDSYLMLVSGSSAEELARIHNIKLEQVQFLMYQLRTASIISPIRGAMPSVSRRSAAATTSTASFSHAYANSSAVLDTQHSMMNSTAFAAPMVQINQDYFNSQISVPAVPARKPSLLGRLLAALKERTS